MVSMKILQFTYIFLLVSSINSLAQPPQDLKRDYVWVGGYWSESPNSTRLAFITYDFNQNPTKISNTFRPNDFGIIDSNSSICDKDGNLLLYTNGCAIIQADHKAVLGAEQINKGQAATANCISGFGYNTARTLMLPDYQEKEGFTLFHISYNWRPALKTQLLFSRVVPNAQTKWKAAFTDSLIMPNVEVDIKQAACRHANGRDWWIVNPLRFEPKAITLLYSKGEIKQQSIQNIDILPVHFNYGGADFTPNGRKYIFYELNTGVRIYDFDRCTGKISNPIYIKDSVSFDSTQIGEMVISPNSRFLYLNRGYNILQYDLEAKNIAESRTEIITLGATTDSRIARDSGFAIGFYAGRVGPDGKIYICGPNGFRYIYIIENPNEKGRACNLNPYRLPTYGSPNLPYFPNFKLGALKGSSCDTLTTALKEPKEPDIKIKAYPNPTSDIFRLSFENTEGVGETPHTIQIFNTVGRVVKQIELKSLQDTNIDTQGMASGVYILKVSAKNGVWSETIKISILR
jgi:Secretion system C-terminal sorting domain